jgi:hypothetical protein
VSTRVRVVAGEVTRRLRAGWPVAAQRGQAVDPGGGRGGSYFADANQGLSAG